MRITRRVVTSRKTSRRGYITRGYILDGDKYVTRGQVVRMAQRGKISTVVAKKGMYGWYVATTPSADRRNLYDLPVLRYS